MSCEICKKIIKHEYITGYYIISSSYITKNNKHGIVLGPYESIDSATNVKNKFKNIKNFRIKYIEF